MLYSHFRSRVLLAAMGLIAASYSVALAQESTASSQSQEQRPQAGERRTEGTVSSIGRGSIIVHTDEGPYMVFEVNGDTVQPQPIKVGSRVQVTSWIDDDGPAPEAARIEPLPERQGLSQSSTDNVPPAVRRLERQIERGARRYRAGFMGGAAIDPELISVNGFASFGPFFTRDLNVRPNLELAAGELTTMIGLHFDVLYTIPGLRRSARWSPYVGAGPNFSFSHRSVEDDAIDDVEEAEDTGRFDFSEFDWDNGLNFIVGARNPNGTFFEMKATAHGVSAIRMLGGFEF